MSQLERGSVALTNEVCPDERPKDVLFVGDSMIKRLQVYGHPQRIWKLCYPGGTAEELLSHILTETLPGESRVGAVMLNIGTNDVSRSRGRIRTEDEVLESLKKLVLRFAKMYPQALVIYISILPRVDCDNVRVQRINQKMREFMKSRGPFYDVFDFSHIFQKMDYPTGLHQVVQEYYRNTLQDEVHLSDSGTQVQQDVFNRYFIKLDARLNQLNIDLSKLMWQEEWERFNYWNLKTPYLKKSIYLDGKRLTNFTVSQRSEILSNESSQMLHKYL